MSIATNRKARHEYHILEKYEAGVALKGSEVKSIREGNVSIKESYVRFLGHELFIIGMHIAEYENRGYDDVQSVRDRKLLLHRRELSKLKSKVDEKGVTMIPLSLYLKKNLIKIEVLPKKLDEEVASYMVQGFGGTITKLTKEQAEYINVPEEGPFKTDIYKY